MDDAQQTVDEESKTLVDARKELEDSKSTAAKELADARKQLEDSRELLEQSRQQIADGEAQLKSGKQELISNRLRWMRGNNSMKAVRHSWSKKKASCRAQGQAYLVEYNQKMPTDHRGEAGNCQAKTGAG